MASVCATWLRSKSILASAILSDALYRKRCERAFSLAQHARRDAGEIDDGARLGPARAGIDDQVELVLQRVADLPGIGKRYRRARQQQRGGEHRLVKLGEQGMRDRVTGDTHADGFLARQAARHFAPRAQDEGIA